MWQYTLIGLFHLVIILHSAYGQTALNETIQFRTPQVRLNASTFYHISDVIDERTNFTGTLLGYRQNGQQRTPIRLSTTVEKGILQAYQGLLPMKDTLQYPITIGINAWELTEKAQANGTIAGQIVIKFSFHWYRHLTKVPLVDYEAPLTYTRSSNNSLDYQALFQKSLDQAIVYFDQWMQQHYGKSTALAKRINITFEDYLPLHANTDTVFYQSHRPITWEDFRALPSTKSKYAAVIFTSFAYEGNAQLIEDEVQVKLTLKVFMVKDMSWRKSNASSDYALSHEQLHFDITKVIANRFRQHIASMPLSVEDYDSQIQYQFIEFFRQMNQLQKAYDDETSHGLNSAKQVHWQQKISQELQSGF